MIYVGVDWAEAHHDVCVLDQHGVVLGTRRVADTLEGIRQLHELVADHADEPEEVAVGIEKDRGLIVLSLVAAGYHVYAVNPLASSRFRDRHQVSGAKSDRGDALVLADMVRTDRHKLREVAGDTEVAEAVKVLARAHQGAIWSRQRHLNAVRNALKDYYPGALDAFGTDLASGDALAVLGLAPTPAKGRALGIDELETALRTGGRRRNLTRRAHEILEALQRPQLEQPDLVADAYGAVTASEVRLIAASNEEIATLEEALRSAFEQHPDAKLILSLPGLGMVLGARVLGEFGDDPNRYASAKSRRNYAGTSPVTKTSGLSRVVLARVARNRRLVDACDQWAFCALTPSPGARRFYDEQRRKGNTHRTALRALANHLVGILHGCWEHGVPYDEEMAWGRRQATAA
jgi:Transposase/Transposase IS116/IS110/IS902 family